MERNRIPDFRRLMDRLAHFGVEETTSGKGSHGTLRLRGREERKQTTWYALRRKADPLPIPFIWECIERLGIGYQDFYRSLSDGLNPDAPWPVTCECVLRGRTLGVTLFCFFPCNADLS
jgi:hypothetical protein